MTAQPPNPRVSTDPAAPRPPTDDDVEVLSSDAAIGTTPPGAAGPPGAARAAGDDSMESEWLTERVAIGQRHLLEQIARDAPLPDVLEGMARIMEDLVPGVLVSVLLLDDDGARLRHGAAPSLPAEYNAAIDGTPVGAAMGSCGTAAFRREPVVVQDILTDPLWVDFREVARAAGVGSCWSTPITSGGELLGTFAMYHRDVQAPRPAELALSSAFTRTAALAIGRHRADEERRAALAREQAARADLRFVLDVSTAVSTAFDYPEGLVRLAHLAVPTLAPMCAVDVVEEGGGIRRVAVAVSPESQESEAHLAAHTPRPGDADPVGRVLASGRTETARRPPDHVPPHVVGYVCVPLTARDRTFGAVTLLSTVDRPLGRHTVALAEDLARRAALGIDNARLYARRARVARELQIGLLPPELPAVPGAELATGYHPAGEGLEVGGDFYDVFPLPEGRWGLLVGDVCGRGPRAAVTTSLVRTTVRAIAPILREPRRIADSVNHVLLNKPGDGDGAGADFVTLVYGELRRGERAAERAGDGGLSLEYVRAGHPAPLLRRADGTVGQLTPGGSLLGLLEDIEPAQTDSLDLATGDALVIVTDGILEARDADGEFFGTDRLVDAVRTADLAAGPAAVVRAVDEAVAAFATEEVDDDRAMLVLMAR
ncbi:SpoIIE family protein phosphatase [Allostreptomyces psammosilenae]|uniref:Serine phosphatase RsbU (Regulator of sigma subunit) n=1 Tax=Allostreptomyces psammosilenae TaxID=1892865 RepID=A0A853A716_9ACTN|nr:SpoIIE family protein phosphatase [Allostreptomyces psammosilenae]NYI06338.1 serine phosphatase RsbU (regulator of sigma subunit) [Allostreptomyces psammosilenae]